MSVAKVDIEAVREGDYILQLPYPDLYFTAKSYIKLNFDLVQEMDLSIDEKRNKFAELNAEIKDILASPKGEKTGEVTRIFPSVYSPS